MAGAETKGRKSDSWQIAEELRKEMGQREEGRRTNAQNEQRNLNQGMPSGTHSSAHVGIHWGPSYLMRSKIEQALPAKEQIEARAYELYLHRGGQDGHDVENWLKAEIEVMQEQLKAN
jgi:hypothetical protein